MKVYIVSANWGGGGPGGIVKDLYYTLVENGVEVRFGYSRSTTPNDVNSFRFGTKLDVYSHAFLTRLFDRGGFYSKRATKALIKDILTFKPDIISIQNPLGYTLNIPQLMRFVDAAGIPTFYTLHDCWLFTGHCTTEICDKLKTGCGNCPNIREFPASFFVDNSKKNLLYKKTHFANIKNLSFISCSKWIFDLAKKSYLRNYKNTIINNGIDLSVFKHTVSDFRQKHGLEKKNIILGVASVWSKRKGQEYFCDLTKYFDDDWKVVLVGKGLKKKTRSCKNILCLDGTNDVSELVKIYSSADVFVNPTVGDNYPTVNLEAIACEVPVVTFDTGGSSEMIGLCGKVVEKGNIHELANSIRKVVENKPDKSLFQQQSRDFDKRIKYKQYYELFKEAYLTNKD